mmetsp:Transcript_10530/g.14633  ORF Transcript_10530/g.14633 Transcript_10530/m.14633 type:complete len:165 (+) Transcript_10530:28-522(+)
MSKLKWSQCLFLFTKPIDGNVDQLETLLSFVDNKYLQRMREAKIGLKRTSLLNELATNYVHAVEGQGPEPDAVAAATTPKPVEERGEVCAPDHEDLRRELEEMDSQRRKERFRQIILRKIEEAASVDVDNAKAVGIIGLMAKAIWELDDTVHQSSEEPMSSSGT